MILDTYIKLFSFNTKNEKFVYITIHIYTSYPFFHFFPTLYSVQYIWYCYSIICILEFSLHYINFVSVYCTLTKFRFYISYQSDIGLLISRQILLVSDSAGLVWLVDMTEKQTPARQTCTSVQQPSASTMDWLNNLAYIADRNFVSNNRFVVSINLSVIYLWNMIGRDMIFDIQIHTCQVGKSSKVWDQKFLSGDKVLNLNGLYLFHNICIIALSLHLLL